MRKHPKPAWLALLLATAALAQQPSAPVAGILRDASGAPIPDAEITATCGLTPLLLHSDGAGRFTLSCATPVQLHIAAPSFRDQDLSTVPGQPLDIVLAVADRADTVDVTTSRSSIPVGASAKTAYALSSEQLFNYPAATLDDSLRQQAGFELYRRSSSRVTNPTSQGISLRGLGSTAVSRTLVLQDGAPVNDPFGGWIHWNEAPETTIDSVNIVTGGGSDLYGSSALGGVIDVIPSLPAPGLFEASVLAGSQSTQTYQFRGDRRLSLIDASLAGEALRTAGYILPAPQFAGTVDVPANVHSESLHTELGRRDFAAQRTFVTANLFNEARGNGTPLQTNGTRLWRYLLGYDTPEQARVATRVRLFGSAEAYRQSFSSIAANRDSEALTRLQHVRTQELGATADATFHLFGLALVTGADTRDIRALDDETPITSGRPNGIADTSARQRYSGGFAELLGQHGRWAGAASIRLDFAQNLDIHQYTATIATAQPSRTEVVPSPRVGVIRTMTPWLNLHASGFRAFRSPSENELYRTGQVGQETTLANPALRSERATGAEAGAELNTARHTLQATYFFTEINRPVSAVLLSQTATTITDMRENLGQIQSRGVELDARLFRTGPLSASLGYEYAHAVVTSFSAQPSLVGNRIPEVPGQTATAQLHLRRRTLGDYTLALRSSGSAFDDSANTFLLRRFFTLDLSGSRSVGHGFEAFALVQNLFNQRPDVSRTPILTLGSGIFAEGGVRLRLGNVPQTAR